MKTAIALIIGVLLIMQFAAKIDGFDQGALSRGEAAALKNDISYRILGEFRDYLSWMSFLNADITFHGGVYQADCPDRHQFTVGAIQGEDYEHHEGHRHDHSHEDEACPVCAHAHGHAAAKIRSSLNILPAVGRAVITTEHKHLTGKEEKELLPWLYYAAELNPHNILAYAVGGYWVGIRLKKTEEAVRFLQKGLVDNPDSWQIYKTIGEIYYVGEGDFGKALRYLEKAKGLCTKQNTDKFDRRVIYVPLSEAYVRNGEPEKAIELYEELLKDFPDNKIILKRITRFKGLTSSP
ncbi:tetratricopeptide repeat protein [Candidatus Omnitrophota bacterium]